MKRFILVIVMAGSILSACAVNTDESDGSAEAECAADSIMAAKAAEDAEILENRVLTSAEISNPPRFRGKDASAFATWVSEKITYPKAAADSLQRGTVEVNFVIDKQGRVVDAKIVRSVSYLLDSIALSIVESSPQWTAGCNEGKTVQVSYTIPVNFTLD